MTYKIATGWNVALEDLDDIVPQPSTPGLQYTRRTFGADDTVYDEGPFIPLNFAALESAEEYQSLLAQFGLTSARIALVTLYAQNENYVWKRFNGKIVKPSIPGDGSRSNFFLRGFVFLVKSLEALD
ncbi:MAG: hypothetical protein IT328_04655 [Caldilineaceae bacterium]|nr:hypothetical protein [Caldilineaceae bacterium]